MPPKKNRLSWPAKSEAARLSSHAKAIIDCDEEIGRWEGTRAEIDSEMERVWYMGSQAKACTKLCHAKRQNCADNRACVYGLGEVKNGVWAKSPSSLSAITMPQDSQLREPLEQGKELSLEDIVKANPVGLKNLGATCYVNSILQVLFNNVGFRDGIFRCGFVAPSPPHPHPPPPTLTQANGRDVITIETDDDEQAAEPIGPASAAAPEGVRKGVLCCHLQRMFAYMQQSSLASYNPTDFITETNLSTGPPPPRTPRPCPT